MCAPFIEQPRSCSSNVDKPYTALVKTFNHSSCYDCFVSFSPTLIKQTSLENVRR